MENGMSYDNLTISSDKLAKSFHNIEIKDVDNVNILVLNRIKS